MDEYLVKTLTKLAKSNINILGATDAEILFEFQWRPEGAPKKWAKSVAPYDKNKSYVGNLAAIPDLVTELRKGLE